MLANCYNLNCCTQLILLLYSLNFQKSTYSSSKTQDQPRLR